MRGSMKQTKIDRVCSCDDAQDTRGVCRPLACWPSRERSRLQSTETASPWPVNSSNVGMSVDHILTMNI